MIWFDDFSIFKTKNFESNNYFVNIGLPTKMPMSYY